MSGIQVNEIGFVCYPVRDLSRAQKFYEDILGLTPAYRAESENGKWQEYDIGGATLALGQMGGWDPSANGGSAALEVADFESSIAHLRRHHVEIVMGPIETDVCHMAEIRDSEGNSLLIHKRKQGHA